MVDDPPPRRHAAYDLQLRRHHDGPGAPAAADGQAGDQPHPVHWAETLIDPTSIDFRILDHEDQVDLIDTTYPPGRNDALQWNIHSRIAGKIPVEIRYFTSGIAGGQLRGARQRRRDEAGPDRLCPRGRPFGRTLRQRQIRLVVGTINLVEKIADLANSPPRHDVCQRRRPQTGHAAGTGQEADEYLFEGPRRALDRGMAVDKARTSRRRPLGVLPVHDRGRETIGQAADAAGRHEDRRCAARVPLQAQRPATAARRLPSITASRISSSPARTARRNPSDMENLGVFPLAHSSVRLFSETRARTWRRRRDRNQEVCADRRSGRGQRGDTDITIARRLKDQRSPIPSPGSTTAAR